MFHIGDDNCLFLQRLSDEDLSGFICSHANSVTALVSAEGATGTAVHVHCSRLLDGVTEECERLRQARRAVVGGRRAVAALNKELSKVTVLC